VEREVWVRAGMFAAIIVLVILVLVTPSLMGHPPSLVSLPILIVGVTPDQTNLTAYVAGSVQAYLYDRITLNVTRLNAANQSVAWANATEAYTYGVEVKMRLNLSYWRIHVWLEDQQNNYFEYNVTVRSYVDRNNNYHLTLAFSFPDDNTATVVTRVPPDDFRIAIPRRGSLP
jgi:hypothetical protein